MNKVTIAVGDEEKAEKDGVFVKGTITKSEFKPNPEDDEHTVIEIEFCFDINGERIEKKFIFSINTTHIDYAFAGELLNVPKIEMDSKLFLEHLAPGSVFDIQANPNPPYDCIFFFGENLSAVMDYDQMFM